MRRLKKFISVAGSIMILLAVSCKSTEQETLPDLDAETSLTDSADELSLMEKVDKSRSDALAEGADGYFSSLFNSAEDLYAKAKSGNVTDEKSLKKLEEIYGSLALLAKAQKCKERIDENDFSSCDRKSYDEGCSSLEQAKALKDASDASLAGLSKTAFDDFTKVLDAAYRGLCKDERIAAFNAKKNADSVKAYISRKTEYDKGVELFKKGDSRFVTKDAESAYFAYRDSKELFQKLYSEIYEARAKAQSAVDAAKKRVAESEVTAEEADKTSPVIGEEEAEGFESEDAKLLEEDDFSSNESSAVELEEDIDMEDK